VGAETTRLPAPLVQPGWLILEQGNPDLRIVDFRWYLDGRSGRAAYEAGHIPGAVFVELDAISGPQGPGRHPLPSRDRFESTIREAGVNRGDVVVAYDDASGSVAGRLWWLLRSFGHLRAAVLDGGIQAWGQPLETEARRPAAGDFVASEPTWADVVFYDDLRSGRAAGVLLDARAGSRYRGEEEPVDPKPGHIPGAKSAPWQENVGADGRYLPATQLRERFQKLGVERGEDAILYCGSGVSTIQNLIAMELAGLRGARIYAGSWSDWCSHGDAPVATGAG
jgi:thiosulfate/3-mercaptopyruvate sulfurtransferase